jgi:hypothetical protein
MTSNKKEKAQLNVRVVGITGVELAPTTPKRASHMLKTGVAAKRFDAEKNFYIEMKIPVRAERASNDSTGSHHVVNPVLPTAA